MKRSGAAGSQPAGQRDGGLRARRSTSLAALLLLALAARAELTQQELRGRAIYRTGESASGTPIVALVGAEDLEVPATSLPCMSCHGRDGRGKDEGGVRPSNLQWHALTRPYKVVESSGRTRPPYTPALLKRAIAMGTDAGKNHLSPVMPRYRMSMRDADDLVAYLARVGSDADPGLADDSILLGTILPNTPEGETMRDALTRHFDAINAAGGIFGRRIRLADAGSEEPFAIVAAHVEGRERDIEHIPAIATFSARAAGTSRYLFPLVPSLEEQCRALIGEEKVRIIHDPSTAWLAARLAAHTAPGSQTVLFLSDQAALRKLLASGTARTILIPAAFTSDAVFSAPAATRIVIALGTTRSPRDTALVAATLLTRALEQAGRDVDRETLAELLRKSVRPGKPAIMPVR